MPQSPPAARRLREQPDWEQAAQALIDGCSSLASPDQRVRFLDGVCRELGDQLYPAFLEILCVVNDQGDEPARRLVAHTMVHALSTGRMPCGRLNAWGGHGADGAHASMPTRSLGPIEYLCAWHAQQSGPAPLPPAAFDSAARAVIALVSCDAQAQALYCMKLREDIDDPLGGSLTRSTRAALAALVAAWERGQTPDAVVQSLLDELQAPALQQLAAAPVAWGR